MSRVPANRFKAASEGPSRRTFLTLSIAAGGGLLLSLKLPLSAWGAASAASPGEITAFVQIDRDGKVHLTMPISRWVRARQALRKSPGRISNDGRFNCYPRGLAADARGR